MEMAELRRFPHVWLVDFEFTQRKGEGERPVLICMSAVDHLSGRRIDLTGDQLRRHRDPPFDTHHDLFIAFAARAEMSCFAALGWPIPRHILDLNIEYRLHRNDGVRHSHKLLHACDYFNIPTIDAHEKEEMINLAIRGAPFTSDEMRALQEYCRSDTRALAQLLPAMAPYIDLRYARVRGRFTGCVGLMEHAGIPVDTDLLGVLREHWGEVQGALIDEIQHTWDLFDGKQLRRQKFQHYIDSLHLPYWPRTPTGWYSRSKDVLRDMAAIYRPIKALREALDMLGQVRTLKLPVGADGRSRTPLWPSSTKTMRCAPSTTEFLFNLPPWLRALVRAEPGHAGAYLDYRQEEPAIAAWWSQDPAMMHGYLIGGDLYVDFAQRALAIPRGLSAKEAKRLYRRERDQYKICLLASMYGQQEQSLSSRMGKPREHATMLLRQLRQSYPRFIEWVDNEIDWALITGEMRSRLGWVLRPRWDTRETSLLNYPMQITGSEILQRAVYLTQKAGVEVCCTVHDAMFIHAKAEDIRHHAWLAKEAMRRASADILSGFELFVDGWGEDGTDNDFIIFPARYEDERGRATWSKICGMLGADHPVSLAATRQEQMIGV
jgi:DNA polymerase-1